MSLMIKEIESGLKLDKMEDLPKERVSEMVDLIRQLVHSEEYFSRVMDLLDADESYNPLSSPIAILNSLLRASKKMENEDDRKRMEFEIMALIEHIFTPKLRSLIWIKGEISTEDVYKLVSESAHVEIRPTEEESE